MKPILRFLFPCRAYSRTESWLLLAGRIAFGVLLMTHGFAKWGNYQTLSATFPDPIGLGSEFSLILAIGAEVFCSLAFIFGFLYRLVLIPMIFTLFMAFFVIHSGDSFSARELPLPYMLVFILMYIAGPGEFSVDRWLTRRFCRN